MLDSIQIGITLHGRTRCRERLGVGETGAIEALVRGCGAAGKKDRRAALAWWGGANKTPDYRRIAVVSDEKFDAVFLLEFKRRGRCVVVSAARLSVVRAKAKEGVK